MPTYAPVDVDKRAYCRPADISTRMEVTELPKINIEHLIMLVTERIELETRRVFTRVPAGTGYETRAFLGEGTMVLLIDDLLEINTITVDGDSLDTDDDIYLMPYGKTPSTWIEYQDGSRWGDKAEISISGAWGYSDKVPWDVWDACVAWCIHTLQRIKTTYQDASAVPELGQLIYAQAMPTEVKRVLDRKRKRFVG